MERGREQRIRNQEFRDFPEVVDLFFQGTGMNGWLVSAVDDSQSKSDRLPTKKLYYQSMIALLAKKFLGSTGRVFGVVLVQHHHHRPPSSFAIWLLLPVA